MWTAKLRSPWPVTISTIASSPMFCSTAERNLPNCAKTRSAWKKFLCASPVEKRNERQKSETSLNIENRNVQNRDSVRFCRLLIRISNLFRISSFGLRIYWNDPATHLNSGAAHPFAESSDLLDALRRRARWNFGLSRIHRERSGRQPGPHGTLRV